MNNNLTKKTELFLTRLRFQERTSCLQEQLFSLREIKTTCETYGQIFGVILCYSWFPWLETNFNYHELDFYADLLIDLLLITFFWCLGGLPFTWYFNKQITKVKIMLEETEKSLRSFND